MSESRKMKRKPNYNLEKVTMLLAPTASIWVCSETAIGYSFDNVCYRCSTGSSMRKLKTALLASSYRLIIDLCV
jgi:hypothetical protein